MKLLQDKIVLITGASRGIGKAIAEECVKQGAKVAFTYLSSDEKAKALEAELTGSGGIAKGFKSDASKYDDAQKLVDDVVAEFGTIDVLVNNAGITRDTLLMRMTEEQWDDVMNTNLKSAFNLTKAVQRPMLNKYVISCWCERKCGSIKLCSFESRINWIYEVNSTRIRFEKYSLQRNSSWIYRN